MSRYIKHVIKKMFMQWETWAVIVLCFAIAFITNIETLSWFPDEFIETAKLRSDRAMFSTSGIGHLQILFMGPLLASIPCACSYYKEKTDKTDLVLIPRTGRHQYYISKAVVTWITGFVIAVLPELIHYLFCVIALPEKEIALTKVYDVYEQNYDIALNDYIAFPKLFMNYPGIDTLVHFIIYGFWVSMLTFFTYTTSLFFRKNIVTTLVASTVANMILALFVPPFLSYGTYVSTTISTTDRNFPAFVLFWAILMIVNIIMLAVKLRWKKDIL